jgi:hypothetical protein
MVDTILLSVILAFMVGVFIQNIGTHSKIEELRRTVNSFHSRYESDDRYRSHWQDRVLDMLRTLTEPIEERIKNTITKMYRESISEENKNEH